MVIPEEDLEVEKENLELKDLEDEEEQEWDLKLFFN